MAFIEDVQTPVKGAANWHAVWFVLFEDNHQKLKSGLDLRIVKNKVSDGLMTTNMFLLQQVTDFASL